MIKNIKAFLRESEKKRRDFLKTLNLNRAAKILGSLISSDLLSALVSKPKETPLSIEKSLKHAKLPR
jgi:hypothetical protein